jgi:hypothetical protein
MSGRVKRRGEKRGRQAGGQRDDSAELYRKDMIGSLLEMRGEVEIEHEIVLRRLRADVLYRPRKRRGRREDLGILDRMVEPGLCIIELYSKTPTVREGLACLVKSLALSGKLDNQARHNNARNNKVQPNDGRARSEDEPPLMRLWIISPGRPRSLLEALSMVPMQGWPAGFWKMPGDLPVHVVAVSDLPATPETLYLRLLGHERVMVRALGELEESPGSRSKKTLTQVVLAWREEIIDTVREDDTMLLAETKARFAKFKNQTYNAGLIQGRVEGHVEGEQELLLKMLEARFGQVPAGIRRRVTRAGAASVERWAGRLFTATTLNDVFKR